jgi:hypothetical protein
MQNTWKLIYKEPKYIFSGTGDATGFISTYQSECKAYRNTLRVGDKVLCVDSATNEVIAEGFIAHTNFWKNTVLGINRLRKVTAYPAPFAKAAFSGIVLVTA